MNLRRSWAVFFQKIADGSDPDRYFEILRKHYTEQRRVYHNFEHIAACLGEFRRVQRICAHSLEVEAALWLHDVVYDPKRSDNEERSAKLAAKLLQRVGVASGFIKRVRELILLTKHAAPPRGVDAAIVVDIDLSILGKSSQAFDRYEAQIRQEYAWVPDEAFRVGRGKVLQLFLNRQWIYSTGYFRNRYEKRARKNLLRSLERLAG